MKLRIILYLILIARLNKFSSVEETRIQHICVSHHDTWRNQKQTNKQQNKPMIVAYYSLNIEFKYSSVIAMVPFSRFIWITNSSDHRRVWTSNLLQTKRMEYQISYYGRKVANSGTPNPPNLLGLMA